MSKVRLFVLALSLTIIAGCATTDSGTRTPSTQDSHDRMVKEKPSWNSPYVNKK